MRTIPRVYERGNEAQRLRFRPSSKALCFRLAHKPVPVIIAIRQAKRGISPVQFEQLRSIALATEKADQKAAGKVAKRKKRKQLPQCLR